MAGGGTTGASSATGASGSGMDMASMLPLLSAIQQGGNNLAGSKASGGVDIEKMMQLMQLVSALKNPTGASSAQPAAAPAEMKNTAW